MAETTSAEKKDESSHTSEKPDSGKKDTLPKGAILVPIDFYPHSEAAMGFASKVAASMKSPIVALHVVHDPVDAPGFYSERRRKKGIDRMEDVAKEMLDQFLAKLVDKLPNKPAIKATRTMLVVGIPVTRILQVVEKIKPVMVVMGSQGKTGLAHAFLGSTAENVARLSPVPVTIVKAKRGKSGETLEDVDVF